MTTNLLSHGVITFASACVTLTAGPCNAAEAEFNVSPRGSNTWSGTRAEPVVGLQDSGRGDSTITYAAYPGETPVFSSGPRDHRVETTHHRTPEADCCCFPRVIMPDGFSRRILTSKR